MIRELKTIKDRQKKENDRNLLAKENEIQELKAQISHQEKKKTEKQTIIVSVSLMCLYIYLGFYVAFNTVQVIS